MNCLSHRSVRTKKNRSLLLAAATAVCCAAAPAWATTYVWTGSAGNNLWSGLNGSTTNWSPNTLPPTTGDISFTQITSFATVNLQTSRTINSVTFGGLQSYTLTGGSLTVSSGVITANGSTSATNHMINAPITLGAAGNFTVTSPATLTLQQPVNDAGNSTFGLTQNGNGTLTLDHAGTSNLYALTSTAGTLNINNSIIATRETNAFAFDFGTTTNVTSGSQLQSAPAGFLMVGGSTTPVLTMDGTGTTATGSTYFVVGINGVAGAPLDIRNHAQVSTQIFLVASDNSGNAGSTATIHTQALVTAADFTLGNNSGAIGTMTVSDSGTKIQGTNMLLGGFNTGIFGGTGSLTVKNAAQATLTGDTDFFTSASTLNVDAATYSTATLDTEAGVTPLITIHDSGTTSALQLTNTAATSATFAGVIADGANGAGSVTKTGAGTQIFTGHNTYTAGTKVQGGTLQLGIENALSAVGPVTVAGATLDLGGHAETVGNFTLTSGTLSGPTGSTLLAGNVSVNAGTIAAPIVATNTITKLSSGTVTDTAPVNANALTISGGIFDAQAGVQAALSVNSGAQFKVRGNFVGSFSAASGGTITLTGGTVVTGSVNLAGTVDVNSQTVFFTPGDLPQVATTTLSGGLVSAPDGYQLTGPLSGYGTIAATISSASSTLARSITASGGTLTIGTFAANDSLAGYTDSLSVGSAQLNLLSAGPTSLGSAATITGGSLGSINGIFVKSGSTLSGYGNVNGPLQNLGSVTGGSGPNILKFAGAVTGTGNFAGNVEFDGSFTPGSTPTNVSFTGNTAFGPVSQLQVKLGGLTQGTTYDHLAITTQLTLGGTIEVQAVNGFVPLPGTQYQIATFGSSTGNATIFNDTSYAGLKFNQTVTSTGLTLTASAEFNGDANLDGAVNISDLNILASHWQQNNSTWLQGDFNNDGIINIADLNALAANWQAGAGSGSDSSLAALPTLAPSPTPEPTSLALLTLASLPLLTRRRR